MWASNNGHLDILQLLASRGVDIHHSEHDERSSLLYAALYDSLPVREYLLCIGADLMVAATKNGPRSLTRRFACRYISPEITALRCATLEAWWAAGLFSPLADAVLVLGATSAGHGMGR